MNKWETVCRFSSESPASDFVAKMRKIVVAANLHTKYRVLQNGRQYVVERLFVKIPD